MLLEPPNRVSKLSCPDSATAIIECEFVGERLEEGESVVGVAFEIAAEVSSTEGV